MLTELGKPLNAVVQMDVDYGELTRRIAGRRTCTDCGRVFNVLTCPPGQAESDICPKTGAPHRLFQRPDDNEATVAERLRVYDEKTKPLIEFYRDHGVLRSINAEGGLDEVTQRLELALEALSAPAALAEAAEEASFSEEPSSTEKALKKKRSLPKSGAMAAKKSAGRKSAAKSSAGGGGAKKAPGKGKKVVGAKAGTRKVLAKAVVRKKKVKSSGRGKSARTR
jgi:adenylate kinase